MKLYFLAFIFVFLGFILGSVWTSLELAKEIDRQFICQAKK